MYQCEKSSDCDRMKYSYGNWAVHRLFALVPAQAIVREFLATFEQFPPRQKSASFGIDQVVEKLEKRALKD